MERSIVTCFLGVFIILCILPIHAQHAITTNKLKTNKAYWNNNTLLMPFRQPLVNNLSQLKYLDLNKDGKPDAIQFLMKDSIPCIWFDDDGDMAYGDLEGDMDNDCLCVDVNKDGIYGGPWDLCIDFRDENNDGKADIQLVIENGDPAIRNQWDWSSNVMWFIDDGEQDQSFAYIDWNKLLMRCWEHYGHSNFYTDYHGQNAFTKMSVSSFRIEDLRYSWEIPFYFFDQDSNGYTNSSIRLEDYPYFRDKGQSVKGHKDNEKFTDVNPNYDVVFTGNIEHAYISWDLDNDAGPANEFDFDMSLYFHGKGYNYNNHHQPLHSPGGMAEADSFLYDSRWRHLTELIYPERKAAHDIIFKKGEWNQCWFVFDEDDDCNRWERVELLKPKDPFKIGFGKGGIDDDPQADALGDRGEWDMDNSGGGQLYISNFDGRLHLYGAELGVWRIDMDAHYYQGYGGLYDKSPYNRLIKEPKIFATVKYTDTDNNGFYDLIEFDFNGDTIFEHTLSFKTLKVDDKCNVINTSQLSYDGMTKMFTQLSNEMFVNGMEAMQLCKQAGLNTEWYALMMHPKSIRQHYDYGYWLNLYGYMDLVQLAQLYQNKKLLNHLDKAFVSGDWGLVNIELFKN